jgi:hypothetical protein
MPGRSVAAFAVLCVAASSCDEDCCTQVDSFPIPLVRAPLGGPMGGEGALIANAERRDAPGQRIQMVIATGSPLTLLAGDTDLATRRNGFDLLDPTLSTPPNDPVVRARFRNLSMLHLPLGVVGGGTGSIVPGGVVGGDLLRGYSVELRFSPPSMTFWRHLGADLDFLQNAGYAVIRFTPYGGGETSALGDEDFLGERGPLVLPATRVVLRGCAVPADFTPDMPRDVCCTGPDAARLATGVDLSLMIDTGLGPMLLSQSAWSKVSAAVATPLPTPVPGTVSLATWSQPIEVGWSSLPRFALVDLEVGAMNDPGACVELGRARRTEQVSYQIAVNMSQDTCAQPCDTDQRGTGLAQSSAAYLEISGPTPGQIPVAIIPDEHPFLQALRFDIRPEGPELDGVVGVAALGRARVELDYRSSPARAIFSCESGAPRTECWAGARCPRLPSHDDRHFCFGLPEHRLAPSCAASGC